MLVNLVKKGSENRVLRGKQKREFLSQKRGEIAQSTCTIVKIFLWFLLQEQQQEHRQALDSLRSTLQRDADLAKESLQAAEKQAGAAEQQLVTLHSSLAASEDRRRTAETQAEVP